VAFVARDAVPPVSRAAAVCDASHLNMSDADMKAASAAWFATHPRTGVSSTQSPAVIFNVQNDIFDSDHNAATKVDTARIGVGETVQWNWVNGIHTVTSGVDGTDPSAGLLFDQPIDAGDLTFSYTFATAGTFPYFCANHWSLGMKGVVIVSNSTPTRNATWGEVKSKYRP
jgi:plastocyanin